MSMGDAGSILESHDSVMGKELFLLGALLIVSLLFIAIFILIPYQRFTLYFALLCILIAILVDMVGLLIITRIFPGLSLNTIIFIWYSSLNWVLVCLILYVHELYRSDFSAIVVKASLVISGLFQLLYVFAKPAFYSRFGNLNDCISIIGVICTIIIVVIGMKKDDKTSWLNVICLLILLITYVHDTLYWSNVIRSDFGEFFFGGLFLFTFIQMIIQAQRIKLLHEQKTAAELAFLQAQIKPHFLYNALNTFISISHYDMDKARNLLIDFSNYLRRS
ncbi:MAG: histidine kinase, partial [Desulfotomaculaceae bacterium]